jgi:ribA/ribD-fused uncharacterized protein
MPVAVPAKAKGSSRWSALFGKSGNKTSPPAASPTAAADGAATSADPAPEHESHLHNAATDLKHAVDGIQGETDVSGEGTNEETNPIQRYFHIKGNQPTTHTHHTDAAQENGEPQSETNTHSTPIAAAAVGGSQATTGPLPVRSDEEAPRATEIAGGEIHEEDDLAEEDASPKIIEFYRRDEPYYWLSNSSDHPIYLDGVRYATAEHLFQSLKFLGHRPDIVSKIRKLSSPTDVIKESRKNITHVKKGWIGKRENVAAMREVLLLKFSQHTILKRQLLLTGDSELVEASPTDAFWGSGAGAGFNSGRNELGKALVRTRETIRSQSGLGIGSGAKTI